MFLDDEIVETILENRILAVNNSKFVLQKVINLCIDRIRKVFETTGYTDNETAKVEIERVFNLWDSAAKKLEKKNFGLLKIGGLKYLFLNDSNFAPLLNKLGIN